MDTSAGHSGGLTITRSGAAFTGSELELRECHRQFSQHHFVRLPNIFDPALFKLIQARVERANFQPNSYQSIGGSELAMRDEATANMLSLLMNGDRLFELIQQLTECERIRSFEGRVYRLLPGKSQHMHWHDDDVNHRLVAVSVNFSPATYSGGCLELRERQSRRQLAEVPNSEPNSAILFRVSHLLEHRVTPVVGARAKTAFSGWFCSEPDFFRAAQSGSKK